MSYKEKSAKELWDDLDKAALLKRRDCLPEVLNFLTNCIPRKNYIKHQKNPYISLWEKVGKIFEGRGRIHEAKTVFEALYHEITAAQIDESCYIPKGMPVVWMRDYCFSHLNQPWLAQRYMLLTIIEDAIASKGNVDPNSTGSYFRAVWFHNIGDSDFRLLAKRAYEIFKENNDMGRFPEWVLLNLEDYISIKYPSLEEIEIYPLNSTFAKYWHDKILAEKKKKGTNFEDFCAYLLNCMPGFEVRRRVPTGDYHFDAFVRNKANTADYRSDFGSHLISESKNWSKPIGPEEIAYFASKMLFHDIRAGIIFSQKGVTGKGKNKNSVLTIIKSFYKIGKIIMIISEEDVLKIIANRNFVNLLQNKYEKSRFTL